MLPLIQLTNIYKVPPPKKIGFNNQNRCDFHCLQEKESSGTHLLWVSFTDRILIVVLPMQIFFKVSKTGLSLTIFQKTYGVLQIKFISAIYDLRRNFRWMTKKFSPPEGSLRRVRQTELEENGYLKILYISFRHLKGLWWGGLFDYSVYSWPSFNQEWNQRTRLGPGQDLVWFNVQVVIK